MPRNRIPIMLNEDERERLKDWEATGEGCGLAIVALAAMGLITVVILMVKHS